mgnify:CR=1 FL=1
MKDRLGDAARILHIIDAIDEIEEYIKGVDFTEFEGNSMRRLATVKQLEIIGEAVTRVSEELIGMFPNVEWRKIKGRRNILVHEYFGIDTELIWQIVQEDLPIFKSEIQKVQAYLESKE